MLAAAGDGVEKVVEVDEGTEEKQVARCDFLLIFTVLRLLYHCFTTAVRLLCD